MTIQLQGRILVIGDVMLDRYLEGVVSRISPEAPVPVISYRGEREVAGGAANVAANLAALGGAVTLIGLVGDDASADRLAKILEGHGVSLSFVVDENRPTVSKLRVIANKQQLLRIDQEDVGELAPELALAVLMAARKALDHADAVIIADYVKGTVHDSLIAEVIENCRGREIPIFIDSKRRSFLAFRGATFIKPNRLELEEATGIKCADDAGVWRAAAHAAQQTDASILVTRSEQGMLLFGADSTTICMPTTSKEVFDVSGAGDTVISTFALSIVAGYPVEQAMRLSNIAAGIVVSKMGTATVTPAEIQAVLDTDLGEEISGEKLVSWKQAVRTREQWRKDGLRVGFTNGCFDLLHPGHIAILKGAAAHCDRLIVALNTDASVSRLKGPSRPIQQELARAEVIGAIGCVNLVVLFDEPTPRELISRLVPDVLVKGADYAENDIVGADIVKAAGGSVQRIAIQNGHSTTNLIQQSRASSLRPAV